MTFSAGTGQAFEAGDAGLDASAGMDHIDAIGDRPRDGRGTTAVTAERGEQEVDRGNQVAHGVDLEVAGRLRPRDGANREHAARHAVQHAITCAGTAS